jgi:hypothetical protein
MTYPINIRRGWIQVTLSPEKKFDNPIEFHELTDPEELLACWESIKQIVDRFVEEQIAKSRAVFQKNARTRLIVDIYNSLVVKQVVDENILIKEVLKTGKFSEEEAKLLIKKVQEEKVDNGGMAWY